MRMLLANSRLSLAVLLAVCCHAQALEPSHHNNRSVHSLNDETRCSWNCTVIDSDLMEEMKTTIAKKKLIRLVVKYEKRMKDKCVNQTSGNSRGNNTEYWEIWLANKQLSAFAKALENVANLMFYTFSNGDHTEIRAICTLRSVNTTAARPTYYSGSSPIFSRSHLPDLGVKLDSIDCNTETTDNLQPCINITNSTGNNSTTFKGPFKLGGWMDVFGCLCLVFLAVFLYYSPAFLCLFTPTEVTEDGVDHIVLDGASPVSLRSLMGNYFFSKQDTIWHRARMFILRAVVLPFPFLGPAIFAEYLKSNVFPTFNIFGVSHLLQPRMIVYCVCYYVLAFYTSFSPAGSSKGNRPCLVCRCVKSKTLICQENLPKEIINHLRIQPLILVYCWGLFIRHVLNYCKKCFPLIPSAFEFSALFFLRLFLFIVMLSASPAVTIILLILILLVVHLAILYTCPIIILGGTIKRALVDFRHNRYLLLLSLFVCISVAIPALGGATILLGFAGFGISIAIISAFVLILSEESLPFVACFVLVLYYCWSSYSSFTNKYQDLALALFKHYKSCKKSQHSQVTTMTLNTDSVLENTPKTVGNKDNVMKIPKELFHMAYEELMPIRERVCVLILNVTIIVSFVLFVFSLAMLLNVGTTPVMRALLTLLSGSFPKIVAIYMDGGRQKKIEAMIADETIPEIVQEYINGTSGVNQRQENSGADVDEEMLQNVNEENIELAIM